MELSWLPEPVDWERRLRGLATSAVPWADAVALARHRLDATRTNALDRAARAAIPQPPPGTATPPVRLALLSSCTTAHLHAAIRVAGLRRNVWIDVFEPEYGQYLQALSDPRSALHRFAPTATLLALDAHHLAGAGTLDATEDHIRRCCSLAGALRCPLILQVPLPLHPALLGLNEHRLATGRASFVRALSERLRGLADELGADLLPLDTRAALDGLDAWHDAGMWFRAKQEVAPRAAPLYGDLVARLLAAQLGASAKCLVLDLDNTLWGGVVGDDGADGIELGQGSPLGEAFVAVQDYARELSRRGVILAVCSKNDERNALEPFERHPEMVLRRADIACFVANWDDKATNLRRIAAELNIGLDALVLLDDNPFERALVRRELPMVSVPEISDEPASYPRTLADAGYFEAVRVTGDDRQRAEQYRGNAGRAQLREASTDLGSYLQSLEMRLLWRRFDGVGLPRIVQLINKTNQFNLTTRRRTEAEVAEVMADPRCFGLQLRLVDRLGDNGMVAVVIGRLDATRAVVVDTWLMSCRVLGRGVEAATLDLVARQSRELGATRIVGRYRPTAKNGMVRDHYELLGFKPAGVDGEVSLFHLDLADHRPTPHWLCVEGETVA